VNKPKNIHRGSNFAGFLHQEGIYEEVEAAVLKKVIAVALARQMDRRGISVSALAAPAKMKRLSSRNSSIKSRTTVGNLEGRFDAGKDVLDYFHAARAIVTHGGGRPGAGRKPAGKLRKTVKLSSAAVRRFQAYARRKKLPNFSAALETVSSAL